MSRAATKSPLNPVPGKTSTRQRDWAGIKADYQAGQKSLRQIGAEHGASHTSIRLWAKQQGWSRATAPRSPAATPVSAPGETPQHTTRQGRAQNKAQNQSSNCQLPPSLHAPQLQTETQPQIQEEVIRSQRQEIPRAKALAAALLRELETQSLNPEAFEQLGQQLTTPGEKEQEKQLELFRKTLSLPSRVSTLKSLTDTLKILVALERQIFDIEGEQPRTSIEGLTDQQVNQRLQQLVSKIKA